MATLFLRIWAVYRGRSKLVHEFQSEVPRIKSTKPDTQLDHKNPYHSECLSRERNIMCKEGRNESHLNRTSTFRMKIETEYKVGP